MKLQPGILSRYLMRQFIPSFVTAVFFFTFIIIIFLLKDMIIISIEKKVPIFFVIKLFAYSLGWTLGLTIPMGILMSVIMTMGALSTDSEIIAMRAGGVTYPRIFRPFLVFGIFLTIGIILFNHNVIPFCKTEVHKVRAAIANYDPVDLISETGRFLTIDKSVNSKKLLYIENKRFDEKLQKEKLINVQIRTIALPENRVTQLIVAKEAVKISKPNLEGKTTKALRLFNGYIFTNEKEKKSFQKIDYVNGSLDLNLTMKEDSGAHRVVRDQEALYYSELKSEIERLSKLNDSQAKNIKTQLELELHKRTALPFAILILLFLGFPLGVINRRSGKGMGLGISIIFIFIYYMLFLLAESLSKTLGIFLSVWLANFVLLAVATYFFIKRTADGSLKIVILEMFNKKS